MTALGNRAGVQFGGLSVYLWVFQCASSFYNFFALPLFCTDLGDRKGAFSFCGLYSCLFLLLSLIRGSRSKKTSNNFQG